MDAETKQLLKQFSAVLRDTTEQAYYVHELALRLHSACSHNVAGFDNCFQSPVQPELSHINDAKQNLLQRLDMLIRSLE